MLEIDRSARAHVAAPPERCRELLADVERYPEWSSLLKQVERLDPDRVRLRAEVLGLTVEMDCAIEFGEDRALLTRLPYDASDNERYATEWTVAPDEVRLHVTAALDVP